MQRRSKDVSVIVPLTKARVDFFQGFVLPSIEANEPKEIIIVDDDLPEPVKVNQGVEKATGKYLFFCDDETIMKSSCLETLASYLEAKPEYSFAYCNFILINLTNEYKPPMKNTHFVSVPWDPVVLRELNYIDKRSLIKSEDFMGFDPSMPMLHEWEMWMRMAKAGKKGLYTPHMLYFSCKVDAGLGAHAPIDLAYRILEEKHPSNDWPFKNVPRRN